MKRIALYTISIILFACNSIVGLGQVYQGYTFDELVRPLQQLATAHNEAMKAINSLSEYVVDVLGHDIDEQLRREMNAELKNLDNLAKQLSSYGYSAAVTNNYNTIYRSILQKIADYNNRIARIREQAARGETEPSAEPENWSGSGFALRDGYIATNYHVVERAQKILVHGINGDLSTGYVATVIGVDRVNDLAIIKITDTRFSGFGPIPYSINQQMADVGEDVWVLGYPMTQILGNEIKLTTGIVSSRSGFQGDVSTYQISAPIQPGNSGGPLFDSKGNVIGIVNAGVRAAENVGYAIKVSYLQNLIESYSLSSSLPQNNTISSLALKDQVKRVKDFVYFLVCSSGITSRESTQSSYSRPRPSGDGSSSGATGGKRTSQRIRITADEFNKMSRSDNSQVELHGVVTRIQANDQQGKFYLKDETGEVYIYGLVDGRPGSNQSYLQMGIVPGDTLTILGRHTVNGPIIEMTDGRLLRKADGPSHAEILRKMAAPDEYPTFKGKGTEAFSAWVTSHLKYPKDAKSARISGTVRVKFVVGTNGAIQDVEVEQGVFPSLDAEAVRVVKSSPKWKPAIKDGKPVRMVYHLPVIFAFN